MSAPQRRSKIYTSWMLDDHLAELAHHYSRSANVAKAVHYLKLAGEQAGRRSAYEEALGALQEAIDLLAKIPASRERDRLELELRVAHGSLYVAVRGFATAEMEPHVGRLRELCDQLGDAQVISGALFSLWSLNLARARLKEAMPQAKQLLNLAAQLEIRSRLAARTPPLASRRCGLGNFKRRVSIWSKRPRSSSRTSHAICPCIMRR